MNQFTKMRRSKAIAGAAGMMALTASSWGQTADALIDKLVEKGILNVKEANQLREESDKGFNQAYSVKSGMPDWVTSFKINGDFRGRYESFTYDNNTVDRDRFRYRARLGFTAVMQENFEVGLRLASGDLDGGVPTGGIDPISTNQTLQNNASKKGVFLDLAYAKWSPLNTRDWTGSLTFGKMENPFVFPSTMMFDRDYTPEGGALELALRAGDQHTLKLTGAGFILDELAADSNDPFMAAGQVRWDAVWSPKFSSSLGASVWRITSPGVLVNGAVPNISSGNTRVGAAGTLVNDYNPIQADVSLTYTVEKVPLYPVAFPITVFGEVLRNPGAATKNMGYGFGVMLGKSGKKGQWDFSYQYRYLEGDAWYEELPESDFGANYITAALGGSAGYRSGTNVKGHIFRGQYTPWDMLTFSVTYFLTDLIDPNPAGSASGTGRLQVDAVIKF